MENKTILVTGGTGSLGQVICRKLLEEHSPREVIILSNDEQDQHRMRTRLFPPDRFPVRYVCADMADFHALWLATQDVDYVIHSAAMKHVHVCEDDPEQAVRVNVNGAFHLKRACLINKVKRCVFVSTDKAIHAVNVYGACKFVADMGIVTRPYSTLFSVIRFGNFWKSEGSVFDTWEELYKKGQTCLPVTDDRATRFFIPLNMAAEFTLNWLERSRGGEIVAPKMPSMRVIDVARDYFPDCTVKIIGLKQGEKLHEKLITPEWSHRTRELPDCYITDFLGRWKDQGQPVPVGFCYGSEDGCQSS